MSVFALTMRDRRWCAPLPGAAARRACTAFCTSTAARSWSRETSNVDGQRHRPVARVGRRVVEHPLQAGELLLDRRRHRLRHVLGGRAGIDRGHPMAGGEICGYCATGSSEDRQQPEQGDDDGDHRRQHRPADEEVARLRGTGSARPAVRRGRPNSRRGALGTRRRRGRRGTAGRVGGRGRLHHASPAPLSARRPRSRGHRPRARESMIHSCPVHGPGVTSRADTLSPAPTTYTNWRPSPAAPRAAGP